MSAEVKVFRKYKLPAVLSICRCFFFWFRSRSFTTIFHNTSYIYTPIPSRYDCARPVLQQKHETCMVFVKLYSIFTYIHRIWAYDVRLKVIVLCVALSWRYSDSLPQHNDERFGIKLNIVAIDTHKSTEEETKKKRKGKPCQKQEHNQNNRPALHKSVFGLQRTGNRLLKNINNM